MKPIFSARDLAVTQACVAALLFILMPILHLIDNSQYKWLSMFHGIGATLTVLLSCYMLHLIYPLLRGKVGAVKRLKLILLLVNILTLASIVTANWLYIGYRAPDGARQWFIYHHPSIHLILMEYKEFVALFPVPLGIGALWILHRFGKEMEQSSNTGISSVVAILLTLMWICLMIGFVFGLAMVKIKGV
ncbi:hypothetical protein [Chengkuizengella axinellae]|uniref:DUF420 domain-containing protein n=1 Tax=Chengkuizengella axinellae TaxID=3064388 RepID=A0ABT9J5X8_9BACL|nr:hypothetical protein [Chengkuizengella sp. 2205SS18-9]MDP5277009.1 hypothetical protein [Chengkuizengella sp. 2205SS18-9]